MMKLLTIFDQNPIIVRSLRYRRLNWRLMTALGLALLAYCPAGLITISFIFNNWILSRSIFDNMDELGTTIFYLTMIILLVIVTLFAPVMSVSAIAGEKQRQTLDLLVITLLPTRSIVFGKLISTLVYILLLIAAVWPLILLTLITGGVEIFEFLVGTLVLLMSAIAFTVIGLFVSSLGKTTTNATMLTYGLVMPGFLIGPFLGMAPVSIILNFSGRSAQRLIETINFYGWSLAASLNPITAAIYSAILRVEGDGIILAKVGPGDQYSVIFPWITFIIFYSFVTWLLIQLTIQRLDQAGQG